MNQAITSLLNKYNPVSVEDYLAALREIIQQIALLGLWRSKFFEHAAFYGGTALRIFHGLPRFSEDLDFSLASENPDFTLTSYLKAVQNEIQSFGFIVEVAGKEKHQKTPIESAFIKAETVRNFLMIQAPQGLAESLHRNSVLKVRMEVDINPPPGAVYEMKTLLVPIPHQVKIFSPECLFAGKIHALLCRQWKSRVKGRDFFDFVWFLGQETRCHLAHLKARMVQTGHFMQDDPLDRETLVRLLQQKFKEVNIENARKDAMPFIADKQAMELWSPAFFIGLAERITTM